MERTKCVYGRLNRYNKKKYRKRKKWEKFWTLTRKFLVLAERIRKKSAPGKFYKQSVQNISYFNKEKIFLMEKSKKLIKSAITG